MLFRRYYINLWWMMDYIVFLVKWCQICLKLNLNLFKFEPIFPKFPKFRIYRWGPKFFSYRYCKPWLKVRCSLAAAYFFSPDGCEWKQHLYLHCFGEVDLLWTSNNILCLIFPAQLLYIQLQVCIMSRRRQCSWRWPPSIYLFWNQI